MRSSSTIWSSRTAVETVRPRSDGCGNAAHHSARRRVLQVGRIEFSGDVPGEKKETGLPKSGEAADPSDEEDSEGGDPAGEPRWTA